jgi:hypothetical protein
MTEDKWQGIEMFSFRPPDLQVCERIKDSYGHFIEIWAYKAQLSQGVLVRINHSELAFNVKTYVQVVIFAPTLIR